MARIVNSTARYNRKIPFFSSDGYEWTQSGQAIPKFDFKNPDFYLWCSRKDLLRENLESLMSGADFTKRRVYLQSRYTDKVTEDMMFVIDGTKYNVIVQGMDDKSFKETVIIGEVAVNSGY